MALSFSQFRKKQLTYQIRYDEAYVLWDRAGALWTHLARNFEFVRMSEAAPNNVSFNCDNRYTLNVTLQSAALTDWIPKGASWDEPFEKVEAFHSGVVEILNIKTLTRIGTRFQFEFLCPTIEEAKQRVLEFPWAKVPKRKLFHLAPDAITPRLLLDADDGEIGFTAQLYARKENAEFSPGPDLRSFDIEEKTTEKPVVILDFDFMTKQPMSIESFEARSWLDGWRKAISRDADNFLNFGA